MTMEEPSFVYINFTLTPGSKCEIVSASDLQFLASPPVICAIRTPKAIREPLSHSPAEHQGF